MTIGCSTDTAANWLVPALGDFIKQYPEIQIQLLELVAGEEIGSDIEVGILSGLPKTETYKVEGLRKLQFYPVCAPALISGASIALKTKDILDYRLLHSDNGESWNEWLSKAGIDLNPSGDQLFLPNVFTMLVAARQGLGIALAQDLEVAEDLQSGNLVQLSDMGVTSQSQYYLITLKDSLISDRARVFADWLRKLVDA